ncbi:MAG: uracil-DNA glycosylase [Sterolibacteriaceae bacterium]|nr:uracil-DNA glycosylase [Candidatus Methylophosphatis haderslevensis]
MPRVLPLDLRDYARRLSTCRECPRLAGLLDAVRLEHSGYFAAPVPPFGRNDARLLVVGLAPGMHGANRTGRPFTGDYAGILLYQTLHRFGFATRPVSLAADDGLELIDCLLTNAVKCLPPQNKPATDEIHRCNEHLKFELQSLSSIRVVLALGLIAHRAVLRACGMKQGGAVFAHGARHVLPDGRVLIDSYHCSRYNTNTGRLTESSFHAVFGAVRRELAASG